MKSLHLFFLSIFALLITTSCTKEIEGNLPDPALKLVVDGSIETDVPPILTLTRTTKIFGGLNLNDLSGFFVHNADVWIADKTSGDSVKLVEFCLQDLPFTDSVKAELLKGLGILAFDSNTVPNVCIYTVPDIINYALNGTCQFYGKEEHEYSIFLQAESKTITGTTTIPKSRPINFLKISPHPNPQNDSLVNVLVNFTVPNQIGNFIRYWTKQNGDPFYPPLSQSVYDDKLFSGLTIELPLERGQPQSGARGDDNTYGFFWKGDTVTLKWAAIDSKTYDFFSTLENDGTGNPFANQVRVKPTVEGGLGSFVGYAATYTTVIVPK
jgi:hypothetical protein